MSSKEDAKKKLQQRPCLVLFYMIGCPHCEANESAWKDAKAKAPKGTKVVEVESENVPDDEEVEGFPTMKYKKADGTETKTSGEKSSGDEILEELEVPRKKKGGSRRARRTHRVRNRKFRHRTLRNYVTL
jgi:hypothetical protein